MRERRRRFHLPAPTSAMLLLTVGFAVLISVGTILLTLPLASVPVGSAPVLTALFTATSATCVTGLVIVESATYWTGFGHAVLAGLMFLGGLGIMTSGTVLLVAIGRRITLSDRLVLRDSMGAGSLQSVTSIGRKIVFFAVVLQLVGFLALLAKMGADSLHDAPRQALFLSISAFNNAGFSIIRESESLSAYHDDLFILGVVGVLIVFGAISLPVLMDLRRHRRISRWSLDTKLVLVGMALFGGAGTLIMVVFELSNPATLGGLGFGGKLANAMFISIGSRTSGFSTVSFADTHAVTDVVFMLLMFVGGASGSTAGGIKVNTLMVLLVASYASVRGTQRAEAFRRELAYAQVLRALAIVFLAIVVLMSLSIALAATERGKLEAGEFHFLDLLFEVVSAFGTTGLSRGITAEMSGPGHIVLVIAMYIGRLGPLTIALGLALRERRPVYRFAEERVRIG